MNDILEAESWAPHDEIELTILMPCLNEALTLQKCIDRARAFLDNSGIKGEILIADNGSTDTSRDNARNSGARVVEVAERGYGAALIGGIAHARGNFTIMGDADDSYDFLNLTQFVDALRRGAELVVGNRFKGGIEKGAMPPLHRWLGNPVLSALGRLFFRLPIGDFHCGLRGFKTDSIKQIHLSAYGMEFATEMLAKAAFAKLKTVEVPTTLKKDGRDRPPHLRTWRDGWRHLRFMLLFSPYWLFLLPGTVLLLVGVGGMAALSNGPIILGPIGLDVHTMLFCSAAATLGLQTIYAGALIQWIAISAKMRQAGEFPAKERLKRFFTLETGLMCGTALLVAGLYRAFALTDDWFQTDFNAIIDSHVLRHVIIACWLLVTGAQIIFCSSFAAALKAALDSGFIRLRTPK